MAEQDFGKMTEEVNTEVRKGYQEYMDSLPDEVKTEMNLKQSVKDYNESTKKVILPIEIKHSYYNHKRIWKDINETHKGFDLGSVEFSKSNGPALIVGSGQSLDKAGPLLKNWQGAIFCSTSQASTLCYYDRPPEYIVALDPRLAVSELSYIDTWDNKDSILIAHPCISPVVLDFWPNKIFYYRIMEPTSNFYTETLAQSYDFISLYLFLFSCAIAGQLGLAKVMGYDPLYLVGCDFGAPNDIYRYTSYRWKTASMKGLYPTKNENGQDIWRMDTFTLDKVPQDFQLIKRNLEIEELKPSPLAKEREVICNNGVKSDAIQVYYKRSVMCVARLDMSNIINTSTEGIITEFPEATIEEVIEKQGRGFSDRYFTTAQKRKSYDEYLATQNTFVIEFKDGSLRYIESKNPLVEMPVFLKGMEQHYKASGRKPEEYIDTKKIMSRVKALLKKAEAKREKIQTDR